MDTLMIHVTAIRRGGVYGHETSHCDESGCSADELFFKGLDPADFEQECNYEIAEDECGYRVVGKQE